jgi:hypothetical protein
MIYFYFQNMSKFLKVVVNYFIPNYFIIIPSQPEIQNFKKITSMDCNINKYNNEYKYYKNKPYPHNLYPTDLLRANH